MTANSQNLILVVDDEEDIREILSETLENIGHACLTASDGGVAIEILEQRHDEIDVVICDLKMPRVAGDQVIRHVNRHHPLIPIIILTGHAQLDMALEHLRLGAFDYMTKPFRVQELQHILDKALEHRRLQIENLEYRNHLEHKVIEITQALNTQVVQTVSSLILAIEEKDRYTQGHSKRVAEYCALMAEALQLSEPERRDLIFAAQLHDIGKIGISEHLLNKPGRLNMVEYETIKTHPSKGVKILEPLKFLSHLLPAIESHHERYDGQGYPHGLKGEEIPLFARIIAVCDTFDAMTSERSYRKPLPLATAIREIEENAGSQFDPQIATTFIEVFKQSIRQQLKQSIPA